MTDRDDDRSKKLWLSESTPIKLGFLVTLLGTLLGGIGAFIWWAATINAKLETLVTLRTADSALMATVAKDVSELQRWRIQVDAAGSPTIRAAVDRLEKDLEALRVDVRLHMDRDVMKGKTP